MFASHSQAKQFQVRFQLANLNRGEQNITDYFGKVCSLTDILTTTGSPLPDQEFVTYLLTGLGSTYESFVTFITTQAEPISSNELYQLLLIHEDRLSHTARTTTSMEPSINFTNTSGHGLSPYRGGQNGCNGTGRVVYPNQGGRSSYNQSSSQSNVSSNQQPTCQVCQKASHVTLQCRHRFDHSYQYAAPPSFSVNYTNPQPKNFLYHTWYPNSIATHHITHDVENLYLSFEPYSGNDQIRVSDGSGLSIQNTGDSSLSSPSSSSSFFLRHLLHVPSITKYLVFVSKFCQ